MLFRLLADTYIISGCADDIAGLKHVYPAQRSRDATTYTCRANHVTQAIGIRKANLTNTTTEYDIICLIIASVA